MDNQLLEMAEALDELTAACNQNLDARIHLEQVQAHSKFIKSLMNDFRRRYEIRPLGVTTATTRSSTPRTSARSRRTRSPAAKSAGSSAGDSSEGGETASHTDLISSVVLQLRDSVLPPGDNLLTDLSKRSKNPSYSLLNVCMEAGHEVVSTDVAAAILGYEDQTLRKWHCKETWPDGIRSIKVGGRLRWNLAQLYIKLYGGQSW